MRLDRRPALALLLAFGAAQGAMYKWVDDQGRVQYSDKPPADRGKAAVEMTNRGVVVKRIEPGPTAEQKKAREEDLARKKEEDAKAAEQRRQDQALLQSFTSVQEIDMKRDREVQAVEALIANLRGQERSTSERIADDRRRLDAYAKRNRPPPDSTQEDIQHNQAQLKLIRDEIERRHADILATRTKYEALKKRYLELREQEASAAASPAAPAAPAKK